MDMDKDAKKVFNDPVHGQVTLPALCVKIIDTAEFQRLRRIKQLGGVYYVYYGASHNRFEHSIGVCYLAGELVTHLMSEQKGLKISAKDLLCVQIAALCHDLGHGPFSHLWDKTVLPELKENEWKVTMMEKEWKHEDGSEDMFDYLVKKNKLDEDLKKCFKEDKEYTDSDLDDDMNFIKDLMRGEKKKSGKLKVGETKDFLYQIVANKKTGIDVDKWDYFARDCYYLGLKSSFEHWRFIKSARVLKISDETGETEQHICYRDKEALNVYGMFYTRNLLHQRAYQHKTVKAVERMLADALILSNEFLTFLIEADNEPGSIAGEAAEGGNIEPKRKEVKLCDTIKQCHMEAYVQLDDNLISRLVDLKKNQPPFLESPDLKKKLEEAQEILKRFENRKLYKCFRSDPIASEALKDVDSKKARKRIIELSNGALAQDDIAVELVPYNYGKQDKNPVETVYFYAKQNPDVGFKISRDQVSMMLPSTFQEHRILMFWKRCGDEKLMETAEECFKQYLIEISKSKQ